MMSNKKKFSWWIIPLAVVVALVGSFLWFRTHPVLVQAQSPAIDLSKLTTTTLRIGSITTGIGATGTVQTNQSITLSWQTSGHVGSVSVKKGDQVQANQVLAQIDPASSTLLETAQADLLTAQQNLANIQNVAVAQAQAWLALVKAQAAVQADQNTLTALNQPPSQASISEANYATLNDQQMVKQLQDTYNYWVAYMDVPHCAAPVPGSRLGGGGFPGGGGGIAGGALVLPRCITMSNEQILLNQARSNSSLQAEILKMNSDQSILNSLLNFKPDTGLVATAQNNLAIDQAKLSSAQATWNSVKNGPDPNQVAAAEAKIASIQATLSQQFITAPFAGTVTDVSIKQGDLVNSGTVAFEVDNMNPLYVDLQVSEVDINNVKIGQPVQLSYYASPNKTYSGQVTAVGQIGTVTNGVSNFDVTVVLTDADSLIKPGMTAGATVVTGSASNVLVVPLQAILTHGSSSVIYVLSGGQVSPVTVTVGLSSNTQAAVSSNSLKAGDVIVTNPTAIPAATAQTTGFTFLSSWLNSLGVTTASSAGSLNPLAVGK